MRVQLLGRVCALDDAGPVEPAGMLRKGLLAILALHASQPVPASELIEMLWGESPPATATNTLQTHVSYLRRLLGGRSMVPSDTAGYRLGVAPTDVDAQRAEQLLSQAGDAGDPHERRELLGDLLSLWRGPSLVDARGIGYVDRSAARLDGLRLTATQQLIQTRLDLGDVGELIPELEDLVVQHPFMESLHGQLMLALYRVGRQADALAAYQRARTLLLDELGVSPGPELATLHTAILRHDVDIDPRSAPPSLKQNGALPDPAPRSHDEQRPRLRTRAVPSPLASFVGREKEIDQLAASVRGQRLVSVLGPGGVGKTRLVLEVCTRVEPDFEIVGFVDLAGRSAHHSASPSGSVLDELMRALGIVPEPDQSPAEALTTALTDLHALVVVDNCEHVLPDVAAVVAHLLEGAPRCHALLTSREAVRLPGEVCLRLSPLTWPETDPHAAGDDDGPGGSVTGPALDLLVQRVRASDPGFDPGADDISELVALCRRLDGLPLAIELAAARMPAFPAAQLLESLAHGYAALDLGPGPDPRHRSLEATLRWSHDLLNERQRAALRRFGTFVSGASPELAAEVCGHAQDLSGALDLAALVEKSLLQRSEVSVPGVGRPMGRLTVHQIVADFARARLVDSKEEQLIRRRHATAVLRLLRQRSAPGPHQGTLHTLEPEQGNITAAVAWAREHDPDLALELGGAAWWFWFRSGRSALGLELLSLILDEHPNLVGSPDPGTVARARNGAAYLAWIREEHTLAREQAEIVVAGSPADSAEAATAHGVLARVCGDQGDFDGAVEEARTSCVAYQRCGDSWGYAWSLRCSAMAHLYLGHMDAALAQAREGLEVFARLGDAWGEAGSYDLLSTVASHSDDPATAVRLAEQSVALHRALADTSGLRLATQHLAEAREAQGDPTGAYDAASRALDLSHQQGYRLGAIDALLVLARTAASRGDTARATAHAQETLLLARSFGDRPRTEAVRDAEQEATTLLASLGGIERVGDPISREGR